MQCTIASFRSYTFVYLTSTNRILWKPSVSSEMNRSAITRLFAIAPLNSSNGTCINISVSARSINSSTARVRSTSKSCLPTFIYVQPQEASPVSSLSETRSTFRTLLASSSIDTGVPECFAKLFCCSYASWCSPTSRRLQTCAPSGETAGI